jgi:hypothetical protein
VWEGQIFTNVSMAILPDASYRLLIHHQAGGCMIRSIRRSSAQTARQRFGEDDVGSKSETLKQKAYHELKEYVVIVLYLWLVFGLFLLYKSVILNEEHISYVARGIALINALVLGKFILIAKAFHLGGAADDAPLIYTTLLKSALFSIVLACCKILEDAAVGLYHGKSFSQSISNLAGGTLKGILTVTLLMFVMLIPFFGFGELQRVLGEGKLAQLFFRPRKVSAPPKPRLV